MVDSTSEWWNLLRAISALNAAAWLAAALWLVRRRQDLGADAYAARRLQLLLSAGYVLGCAWRSLLPVYDVQRLVLADTWWSSVIVGRSVATLAELCFVAQWALLLREASQGVGSRTGHAVARVLLPLILLAELCSWYSVLTLSNIGHVVEESLWGLCAALLVASLLVIAPRLPPSRRPLLIGWCVAGAVYVAYMLGVDVPMYWQRWMADELQGRTYLGLLQGVADASQRWVVSHHWDDWKGEVTWMTLYFSVAVWLSITLVLAPVLHRSRSSG